MVSQKLYLDLSSRQQRWGYSSVAEHSTADREVTGSTPVAPFRFSTKSDINQVVIQDTSSRCDSFCNYERGAQNPKPVVVPRHHS